MQCGSLSGLEMKGAYKMLKKLKTKTSTEMEGYKQKKVSTKVLIKNNWQLYLMFLPTFVFYLIFEYIPMYGIQVAFKDFKAVDGIWGSAWVGLKHFKTFLESYYSGRLIINTILLNIYGLLWGFPIPIILAIMLNQIRNAKSKRFIQTTIYLPHFISTVVMAGMLYIFLSPSSGIFNYIRTAMGFSAIDFMAKKEAFRTIYIASGIWQGAGFSSILFIACLAGVDPTLYEAAEIDGANIWQKIRHIDIPTLIPTAVMVFILDCGKVLSSNATKTLLLQTPGNVPTSDVIGVYVYNVGLGSGQFSYTAAIGLFTNIINLILILTVNKISKKVAGMAMF